MRQAPGPASRSRLTDYSLGNRGAAFRTRFPVPKLNHFSQISSRLDRMPLMLVSWQILLPTQKHINHSELCGTNRGTVCTQSHNSVGTRHERRWQGEYLFSCSLYFRWMTQTGRFAWAFFGSTSELMYVIKKTKVHVLLNPTAGGLWGRRTTKHVCSISLTTNSNRDKPLPWAKKKNEKKQLSELCFWSRAKGRKDVKFLWTCVWKTATDVLFIMKFTNKKCD